MGSFSPEPTDPRILPPTDGWGDWTVVVSLAIVFAIRAFHPDQPIVENYVGRQIPTAMVARNLERGSGFFHPELDTGPFPNHFLVEPPIYAQLVATIHQTIGFVWEIDGRLVSAAATTLGAWGLFGLVRRREGRTVALLALGSFGAFPVMIRYGRAFQPDALMLGCLLAGLRAWDESEARCRNRWWAVLGGFVFSMGLALKITSAWVLIPFLWVVRGRPIAWKVGMVIAMLIPAFAWYVFAWGEVARPGSEGSLASTDNAAIWLRTLGPSAWVRLATWSNVGQALVIRSFTPIGFVLAAIGWLQKPRLDPLWQGWLLGSGLALLALAAKWHHAYYWMMVAPVAAVGVGRSLGCLANRGWIGRVFAVGLGSFFLGSCAVQSVSTWRSPAEWSSIVSAAGEVQAIVPEDGLLIAPEALLYYADRRGFRLEFEPSAATRAAGEWGATLEEPGRPLALVDFYQSRSDLDSLRIGQPPLPFLKQDVRPDYVADIGQASPGSRRGAWRAAIRNRPGTTIRVDRPDLLIAELR